ncbi:MAG: GntR family transcriptional regulator [Duncaniella sp.]|nr:GntR family transcriptional regulator [Duncaniella sp.]
MVAFKENNKSIFLQIADMVCEDILAGRLKGGQRMPSVRECAGEMEVNVNTVMRSYEYLAQQGVIFNRRGIGFFVADEAAEIISLRRRSEFLEGEMSDVFRQLHLLNITPDQLTAMYNDYISKIQ